MYSPSGKPCVVCGIFKQAIELKWYFTIDWNLLDIWNWFGRHLPFQIVCTVGLYKVPCIMLRYNLLSYKKSLLSDTFQSTLQGNSKNEGHVR